MFPAASSEAAFSDAEKMRHPVGDNGDAGRPECLRKGMKRMGALIWFMFVAVVVLVLERETFFS